MKQWKKERNHRKYHDEDGTLQCIITVDGVSAEVSLEVFEAYAQEDRRERYGYERDTGKLFSLDQIDEEGMQQSSLFQHKNESLEYSVVQKLMIEQLLSVLPLLREEEQEIITCLYYDGCSIRKHAKEKGLSEFAIRHRKRKLLLKLKKNLEI